MEEKDTKATKDTKAITDSKMRISRSHSHTIWSAGSTGPLMHERTW